MSLSGGVTGAYPRLRRPQRLLVDAHSCSLVVLACHVAHVPGQAHMRGQLARDHCHLQTSLPKALAGSCAATSRRGLIQCVAVDIAR